MKKIMLLCAVALLSACNKPAPAPAVSSPAATGWSYDESKDAMRGTVSKSAAVYSADEIKTDDPMGGGHLNLLVVGPPDNPSIVLTSAAQFNCIESRRDTVSVKFDNGPVLQYFCHENTSGDTKTITLSNVSAEAELLGDKPGGILDFMTNLKTAKHLVLEAEFYRTGRQQLNFNVTGFDPAKL